MSTTPTTGKAAELMKKLGQGLADSVGVRANETMRPTAPVAGKAPPMGDFVRSRSAGEIELDKVMPDPGQPRKHYDEQALAQLSADIKARGLLQPIRVRWSPEHSKWLIIAGERRYRASRLAGLAKIQCIFIDREMTVSEVKSEQLVENLQRENLTALEEAEAYQGLMKLNEWNATQVATYLNISKGKVSKALALFKLPEDLQQQVQAGTLAASTAYQLAKVKDQGEQRQLAIQTTEEGMTPAETAQAVARQAGQGRGASKKRRTTNEIFRTADQVKVVISSRRYLDEAGVINALLEVVEKLRQRKGGKKVA